MAQLVERARELAALLGRARSRRRARDAAATELGAARRLRLRALASRPREQRSRRAHAVGRPPRQATSTAASRRSSAASRARSCFRAGRRSPMPSIYRTLTGTFDPAQNGIATMPCAWRYNMYPGTVNGLAVRITRTCSDGCQLISATTPIALRCSSTKRSVWAAEKARFWSN